MAVFQDGQPMFGVPEKSPNAAPKHITKKDVPVVSSTQNMHASTVSPWRAISLFSMITDCRALLHSRRRVIQRDESPERPLQLKEGTLGSYEDIQGRTAQNYKSSSLFIFTQCCRLLLT